MRIRARYFHFFEAFLDNVIGYIINLGLVILVYNIMLGQDITLQQNLTGGVIFFLFALVRKYTIRRWFSNMIQRWEKKYVQEDALQGDTPTERTLTGETKWIV